MLCLAIHLLTFPLRRLSRNLSSLLVGSRYFAAWDMLSVLLMTCMVAHAFTASLPTVTAALTPVFNASGVVDADIECSDIRFGDHLDISECHMAIFYLPSDRTGDVDYNPKTGTYTYPIFSRVSLEIRHRLPVVREYGSCTVEVNLRSRVLQDQSSWGAIANQAAQIVHKCVNIGDGWGGQVVTGDHSGIVIFVFAAEPGVQRLLNSTISSANTSIGARV